MRPRYFFTADGRTVDESEALQNGVLRLGYGMRNHAMMRDNVTPERDEQAAYEARISDAWKGGLDGLFDHAARMAPISKHLADEAGGQAAYEHRIANSWKGTRHV